MNQLLTPVILLIQCANIAALLFVTQCSRPNNTPELIGKAEKAILSRIGEAERKLLDDSRSNLTVISDSIRSVQQNSGRKVKIRNYYSR